MTLRKMRPATAGALAMAMLAVGMATATGAKAETTTAEAHLGGVSHSDTRTDGSTAAANISGAGSATASGGLTQLRVFGNDTSHFSTGSPGASASSDFLFQVTGASGPVELNFHFEVLGQFNFDTINDFTSSGGFRAELLSNLGTSTSERGDFSAVECHGCGGLVTLGQITTVDNSPGSPIVTPWLGSNPGNFTLSNLFTVNQAGAGRLELGVSGAGGDSSYDFALNLVSITTPGSAAGLTVFDPTSGVRFAVTSDAGSGAVPEPASWILMIGGLGLAGAALRRRRPRFA